MTDTPSGTHIEARPPAPSWRTLWDVRSEVGTAVVLLADTLDLLPNTCGCHAIGCLDCWHVVEIQEVIDDTISPIRAERIYAPRGLRRLADALLIAFDICEWRFGSRDFTNTLRRARQDMLVLAEVEKTLQFS